MEKYPDGFLLKPDKLLLTPQHSANFWRDFFWPLSPVQHAGRICRVSEGLSRHTGVSYRPAGKIKCEKGPEKAGRDEVTSNGPAAQKVPSEWPCEVTQPAQAHQPRRGLGLTTVPLCEGEKV